MKPKEPKNAEKSYANEDYDEVLRAVQQAKAALAELDSKIRFDENGNFIRSDESVPSGEEQTVTITVKTRGEVCEMSDDEIIRWYETHVAELFNSEYGTPQIEVHVERKPF